MPKKITKKPKKEPKFRSETAEVIFIPTPTVSSTSNIAKLPIDFTSEQLNDLARKINEIIDSL